MSIKVGHQSVLLEREVLMPPMEGDDFQAFQVDDYRNTHASHNVTN